ncbi:GLYCOSYLTRANSFERASE [Salix purpurea]|uniref:Glycosyltransferase n=1 Tax=Salix purpurea TaxID=77065 RepID=A0A9Q0ZAR9_SALPP|nr:GLYCOSYLTRANSFERASE [Salix purpurea]
MGSNGSPPHVVIFPFMAQGHTLPLLDLSRALACRGTRVTIITTPANAPFILSKTSTHPAISLHVIPFPNVEELPEGCENVNHLPSPDLFVPFINATKPLKQPFEHILKEMCYSDSTTPICVISDMFLPWTVDSCCLFDIPRIVFSGMGVLPTVIVGNASSHVPCISSLHHSEPVNLPSVPFSLNKTDFPDFFWCADDKHPMLPILSELQQAEYNSWGIVVNSFEELEGDHVDAFEYQKETKAWLVGPLLLHDQIKQDLMNSGSGNVDQKQTSQYIEWLDQKTEGVGPGNVIYVAFGSQSYMTDLQMEEIALGLEMAGEQFIWVVRSKTWVPPVGWEERVGERGLVMRDWVDQRGILAHPVIGGFLTHCGWNSVLEGLSMGVPLLAWPKGAEQGLNARYVAMGLKAGLMVPQEHDAKGDPMPVQHNVICDAVKELMRGDQGKKARERARELGRKARQAVEKGGSSDKKLDELIECLTSRQKNSS